MSKTFTVIMTVVICLFLNLNNTAIAAINTDCSERGCVFTLTDSAGIEAYYGDDGSSAGSLTVSVGSGQGVVSAEDGWVVWARTNSNLVWVYNVAAGGSACSVNVGTPCGAGNAKVFGAYAYKGCGASVKKISLSNCSTFVSIPITGSSTYSLTEDATTLYVLSAGDGTISTIVPPSETSSSFSIGRQMTDYLASIVHVNGTLYTNGVAGIYSVPLPLSGSSALWQALPFATEYMSTNGTYLTLSSMDGLAYLVQMSSPSSYISTACVSCLSVAITENTYFGANGNINAWDFAGNPKAYSPITSTSWSIAYAAPTVSPPICGDNTKNGTDVCDGSDLDGQTCVSRGFDYGTLACAGNCLSFDETDCHDYCGNGSIEAPEQCDGLNLNGQDCVTLGFDTGTLGCSASCTFVTTSCEYNCGNGTIESPEDCDGSNHNGETCTTLGFDSGVLACTGACAFDTTACVTDTCGNGSIDTGEDCDGANLNGSSCTSLGFDAGNLACSATSCTFDTSACVTYVCGNSQVEGTEQCDGANLNGASCSSLGLGTGDLACTPVSCTFDTSSCTVQPVCGNGTREGTEECDNGAANSDTLADACRTNCTNPKCGDNVIDSGEQCDDNNTSAGDGCDSSCNIEGAVCGNGNVEEGEECDSHNLGGMTCESLGLGFTGGTLACTTACSFNTSACVTDPVCEWSGVLEEVTNVTHPDLAGAALEKYTSNTQTLTRSCQIECVNADTVKVVAPSGSYCNFHYFGSDYDVIWHIYTLASHTSPATFRFSISGNAMSARYGGGHILLHDGQDIEFEVGEGGVVIGGTEGTAEMAEFASVHPDTQTPGNWYIIDVLSDTMIYCAPDSVTNCAFLAAGKNGRAVLNLDALGDLTQWNLQVNKPPTCNGCSQASGTPENIVLMLVLFGLLFIWLRFRPWVRMKHVCVRVIKRR